MNKKGNEYVVSIIILTLAVILVSTLLIPQVKNSVQSQSDSDTLSYTLNDTVNSSYTLQYTNLEAGSVSIAGLTENTNYTLNTNTAVITILANKTATGSYIASYKYYSSGYLTNSGDRSLFAVVVLGAIIGLVYMIFSKFT